MYSVWQEEAVLSNTASTRKNSSLSFTLITFQLIITWIITLTTNKQKLANVISEEFQTLQIILQPQSQYN